MKCSECKNWEVDNKWAGDMRHCDVLDGGPLVDDGAAGDGCYLYTKPDFFCAYFDKRDNT